MHIYMPLYEKELADLDEFVYRLGLVSHELNIHIEGATNTSNLEAQRDDGTVWVAPTFAGRMT